MNEIINAQTESFGSPAVISGTIGYIILAVSIIYSLCCCFFGYKLLRVMISVAGFIVGFAVGTALLIHFTNNMILSIIGGVALGIALGIIAFKIYLAGVFIFAAFQGYFITISLLPKTDIWGVLLSIVIAIIIGVLAIKFTRPIIIISSSLGGGASLSVAIMSIVLTFFSFSNVYVTFGVGIALAVVGMIFQFTRKTKPV